LPPLALAPGRGIAFDVGAPMAAPQQSSKPNLNFGDLFLAANGFR
jgi:hypothetical protein